jgi:multidrug efflux pump subunit AcrA (membrane-fusion protein)
MVAKIRIVLQSKQNVLLLPPDAIRSFEGRQFVNVRTGDRESRVPIRTGIKTQDRVEILESDKSVDRLKEGDIVVGQ